MTAVWWVDEVPAATDLLLPAAEQPLSSWLYHRRPWRGAQEVPVDRLVLIVVVGRLVFVEKHVGDPLVDGETPPALWADERTLLHMHLRHREQTGSGTTAGDQGRVVVVVGGREGTSIMTWWNALRNVSSSSMAGSTTSGRPVNPSDACGARVGGRSLRCLCAA